MPRLHLPKQERFAQLVASGKSFTDAYIESRPGTAMRRETAGKHGCMLAKDPAVAARITELQAPVIEDVRKQFQFTLDTAMVELEQAKALAKALAKPETIIKGIELQAKLSKLLNDGKQKDGQTPLDEATTEELLALRELVREKKRKRGSGVSGSSVSEKGVRLKVV